MKGLYVSTKNRDKLRELKALLGEEAQLYHPGPGDDDVEETGATLEQNALLKARAGYERSGLATIADDTGLEVDALDGAPGVYSSRYAGENATYDDNVEKLIQALEGVVDPGRTARFRTVIAYIDGEQTPRYFEGTVEGIILPERRGENGFGYDPVFYVPEKEATLAELDAEEKNAISHRGNAFRAFAAWWRGEE